MKTLIVNISVKDYSSWKSKYDKAKPKVSHFVELAVAENSNVPNNVYLLYQTPSVDVHEDINDPNIQELIRKTMEETGITSINEVTFFQ